MRPAPKKVAQVRPAPHPSGEVRCRCRSVSQRRESCSAGVGYPDVDARHRTLPSRQAEPPSLPREGVFTSSRNQKGSAGASRTASVWRSPLPLPQRQPAQGKRCSFILSARSRMSFSQIFRLGSGRLQPVSPSLFWFNSLPKARLFACISRL